MQQKVEEKIDPLTRIQEEIKEVVRREEEYRQLATLSSTGGGAATPPPIQVDEFETYTINGNGNDFGQDQEPQGQEQLLDLGEDEEEQDQGRGVLVTAQPALAAVQTTALLLPIDEHSNTPSLASSVNSTKEESLDGQHSDDSGISASSQSNNNNNNSNNLVKQLQPLKLTVVSRQEQRYIGPNCYNLTPEPPQQKLMTRTISTPQLNGVQKRQFAFNGSTKGVMQRFIASHGKVGPSSPMSSPSSPLTLTNGSSGNLNGNVNGSTQTTLKLNAQNALAFLETGGNNSPTVTLSPAAIERDSEGRPLRRGYVPVEQKIQRELQDLKSRESELKRLRKLNRQNTLRASQDKLIFSTDDEADAEADDDEDSEEEHCYGPGKLRNAQSTQELDRNGNEQEIVHNSQRMTCGYAYIMANGSGNGNGNGNGSASCNGGMRPAMSLAQLCDLTPEEAPSSHRLIAQWESLIKKNAEGGAAIEAVI
ncbi:ras guanine nucleotide exchange factor Y [Drosophila persimilis]|uniref:ras guanine nucleotide exchange factor Y n=1 Tax=Drosophila persimilis TaxID=7234 RepID=UPI000F07DF1A|nr:ras guanine nucleotide exchange factor Y [Drosophila persimilis]